MGVFETSNTLIPLNDSEAIPFSQIQVVENTERTSDLTRIVEPMKGQLSTSPGAPMKQVQAELEKALAPEIQQRTVDVKAHKEGVIVSLREMGFYVSGSAALQPASAGAIDRLAGVLKSRPESITAFVAAKEVIEELTGFSMYQGVLAVGKVPAPLSLETVLNMSAKPNLFAAVDGLTSAEP